MASLLLLHISSLVTGIPKFCILAAHINIFLSVLPSHVFFIFFSVGQTPCNSLLRLDKVLLPLLWSLSTLVFPLFSHHLPALNIKQFIPFLLTFPLSLCCQGCWIKDPLLPKGDLFCDLFLLYMAWVNMFPTEKYILWNKKTKPSRFLLLLMLFYF